MLSFTPTDRVLVTGANGYLGSTIVKQLLSRGVHTRASVRSSASAEGLKAASPDHPLLEIVYVPSLTEEGAFVSALKDVTYAIHTASPLTDHYTGNADRDLFQPALKGTTTILKDGLSSPTLKKVVVTSSIAALRNEGERVWTEKTWNPVTREVALELERNASGEPTTPLRIYGASKTFAEKAAWEWYEAAKPSFALTTVLPNFLVGEAALREDSIKSPTAQLLWDALVSKGRAPSTSGRSGYVDVRDVAKIHIDALLEQATDSKRLLAVGDAASNFEVKKVAHNLRPNLFGSVEGEDPEAQEKKSWPLVEKNQFAKDRIRPFEEILAEFIDYVTENKLAAL